MGPTIKGNGFILKILTGAPPESHCYLCLPAVVVWQIRRKVTNKQC